MKKIEPASIKILLEQFLKNDAKLSKGIAEGRAVQAWSEVVGQRIAQEVTDVHIREGALHVTIVSSVVRSEVMMNRRRIINSLNKKVGTQVVHSIVVKF